MSCEKLYINGDILTLEDNELYVEALLVKGRKIQKVGTKEECEAFASDKVEVVDLKGKTLMPSFIDTHSHFSGYAITLTQVDLSEAKNFEQIKQYIQSFIKKNNISPGEWIQADGYDHNFLVEKEHPNLELLNEAAPNNPLVCKHKSGHMGVFN